MSPGNISDISSLFFPPRPFQKTPPPSSLSAPACQTGHIFLSFTPLPLNSNKCHNYGCAALLTSAGKQAAPGPSLSGVMRNAVCQRKRVCHLFFFFCFVPPLQLSLDAVATHEVDSHVRHFFVLSWQAIRGLPV